LPVVAVRLEVDRDVGGTWASICRVHVGRTDDRWWWLGERRGWHLEQRQVVPWLHVK